MDATRKTISEIQKHLVNVHSTMATINKLVNELDGDFKTGSQDNKKPANFNRNKNHDEMINEIVESQKASHENIEFMNGLSKRMETVGELTDRQAQALLKTYERIIG